MASSNHLAELDHDLNKALDDLESAKVDLAEVKARVRDAENRINESLFRPLIEQLEKTVAECLHRVEQLKAEKDFEKIRLKYQRVIRLKQMWDEAVEGQKEKSAKDRQVERKFEQLMRFLAGRLAGDW